MHRVLNQSDCLIGVCLDLASFEPADVAAYAARDNFSSQCLSCLNCFTDIHFSSLVHFSSEGNTLAEPTNHDIAALRLRQRFSNGHLSSQVTALAVIVDGYIHFQPSISLSSNSIEGLRGLISNGNSVFHVGVSIGLPWDVVRIIDFAFKLVSVLPYSSILVFNDEL